MLTTIDVSGIAKKKASKGKDYPVMPDPDHELRDIVDQLAPIYEQMEALQGGMEAMEGEIKSRVATYYLKTSNGRSEIPSQIKVEGSSRAVAVQLQDRYYGNVDGDKLQQLTGLIGEENMNQLFESTFSLAIDGSKVPDANAQRLVDVLCKLCSVFCINGAGDPEWEMAATSIEDVFDMLPEFPPSDAVSAKSGVRPKKGVFHTERHKLLTVDQNLELQKLVPFTTALKKKGVK